MKMRLSKSVLAELEKMNEKPRLDEAVFERRQGLRPQWENEED